MSKTIVLPTSWTPEQRAGITECVRLGELLLTSYENKPDPRIQALGAVAFERAANLIRGEGRKMMTDAEIVEFCDAWKVAERAKFNPAPRKMKKR